MHSVTYYSLFFLVCSLTHRIARGGTIPFHGREAVTNTQSLIVLKKHSKLLKAEIDSEYMSESTRPIWANYYFSISLKFLQVGSHWHKNILGKEISLTAFRVCPTSMPLQNGQKKLPHIWPGKKCYTALFSMKKILDHTLLDMAFYKIIAPTQVICLVASLNHNSPQVQSPRGPHNKTVLRSPRSCLC